MEFIQPGKPTQNSHTKRFNWVFRHVVLDLRVFLRLSKIREIVAAFNSLEVLTFSWHEPGDVSSIAEVWSNKLHIKNN